MLKGTQANDKIVVKITLLGKVNFKITTGRKETSSKNLLIFRHPLIGNI